jgi:hypothetical protein
MRFSQSSNPFDVNIEKEPNTRYPQLDKEYHYFFTAGDIEQFVSGIRQFDVDKEKLKELLQNRESIKEKTFEDLFYTFEYMFNNFKKGTLVQIKDNKLVTFLPFSKQNYINPHDFNLQVDPRYCNNAHSSMNSFYAMIDEMNKGTKFQDLNSKEVVEKNKSLWVIGNGTIRYENPYSENDSGLHALYHMLETLCNERCIPDCHFFLHKRDHPLVRVDGNHPYDNLYDNKKIIEKENLDRLFPIFSMNSTNDHKDIAIPNWFDWAFTLRQESDRDYTVFLQNKNKTFTEYDKINDFEIDFKRKKDQFVFRGTSTGIGVSSSNNMRLFLCQLAYRENHNKLFDCKLSSINTRPRKIKNDRFFRIMNKSEHEHLLGNYLSYTEQSRYKYIFHIEGHSCAYRLTAELFFNSVILYCPSTNGSKLWYFDKLEEYVHYVPLRAFDEENILETMNWCINNQEKCEQIARSSREFAENNLRKEHMLDYLQQTISRETGKNVLCLDSKESLLSRNNEKVKRHIQVYFEDLGKMISFIEKDYILENSNYSLQLYMLYVNKSNIMEDFLKNHYVKNLVRKRASSIDLYCFRGKKFIKKTIYKTNEHLIEHQAFCGYAIMNRLHSRYKDNFQYTYYHHSNYLLLEYKEGETLFHRLINKEIGFYQLIEIFIQIACLLQVCQDMYGFNHCDLMPWNIMIKILEEPKEIEFTEFNIRILSRYRVTLLDYDSSHFIYQGNSYYMSCPFYYSTMNDMKCLIIKSLENVFSTVSYISYNEKDDPERLFNVLKNKQKFLDFAKLTVSFFLKSDVLDTYYLNKKDHLIDNIRKVNNDISEMKRFLSLQSKFSILMEKTESVHCPIEFVNYMLYHKLHNPQTIILRHLYSITNSVHKYVNELNISDYSFYQKLIFIKEILIEKPRLILSQGHVPTFNKFLQRLVTLYKEKYVRKNISFSNLKFYDNLFCELCEICKLNLNITNLGDNISLNTEYEFDIHKCIGFLKENYEQQKLPVINRIYTSMDDNSNCLYYQHVNNLMQECYLNKKLMKIFRTEFQPNVTFYNLLVRDKQQL